MKLFLTIFVLLAIKGCVPVPNKHYFAPPISGVLLRNGKAVPNALIRLSSRDTEEVSSANTDEFGRFQVRPLWEIRMMTFLLGAPLFPIPCKFGLTTRSIWVGNSWV